MARIAVVDCADYTHERCRTALRAAVEAAGGLDWVRPGMKIGIKANLVSAMKPEQAATTHPALVRALVELLRERGAAAVVGDSPGGLYTAAHLGRCYRAAGMDETGAACNEDFSVREISLPGAKVLKTATVTGWLLGCDGIINFCKLKSHGMMGMSAAAKNLFGTVPGTMKPEYHFRFPVREDFADMLVDLDEYWKPRLSIVDAVACMEGNGPTAGTPRHLGCILAGENPHALDLLCARLIGLEPQNVPTLRAAIERGLCPGRVEELEISGPWQDFVTPDFETVEELRGTQFENLLPGRAGKLASRVISRLIGPRPKLHSQACIGCGKCAELCPAKAITMQHKKPVIDRSACIRCFCCQEFCPRGAMKVARPAAARLLVKNNK